MSSRPPTPSPEEPVDGYVGCRFHENATACEWGESYRPGGYHPVQLGDTFLNGRFHVIRKIGYGSFSTVWLAHDDLSVSLLRGALKTSARWLTVSPLSSNKLVAIKVVVARLDQSTLDKEICLYHKLAKVAPHSSLSQNFVGLKEQFQLEGPNGRHNCLVFDSMGPDLPTTIRRSREYQVGQPWDDDFCQRFPLQLAKKVLREVLLGLQFLHANRIVHGDLHAGNILVSIRSQDCEAGAIEKLRQNRDDEEPLRRLDGKTDLWAPPYLLPPAGLLEYVSTDLDPFVKLVDLGGCEHEHPLKTRRWAYVARAMD